MSAVSLTSTTTGALLPPSLRNVQVGSLSLRSSSSRPASILQPIDTLPAIFGRFTIAANILQHLDWDDFHALTRVAHKMRRMFDYGEANEAMLARFVPGYVAGLSASTELAITLRDLESLVLSGDLQFQAYRMHALTAVVSEHDHDSDGPANKAYLERLTRLALAHSRFALLLRAQSLARPIPPIVDLGDQYLENLASDRTIHTLPELSFPAPLSYFSNDQADSEKVLPPVKKKKQLPNLPNTLTRRNLVPPPPPCADPHAFRQYRTTHPLGRASSVYGSTSKRTHQRFMSLSSQAPPNSDSSDSGSNFASPLRRQSIYYASNVPDSPHALHLATSQYLAPILRVFVPCKSLSQSAVLEAEDHLITSGLRKHMLPGDIVINLGYVAIGDSIHEDSDHNVEPTTVTDNTEGWLIFTGTCLLPFSPSMAPPIEDPTSLPSPTYYFHLLPQLPLENPMFHFTLPPYTTPRLDLVLQTAAIPTARGNVKVKRHVWLGKFDVQDGVGERWRGKWVIEAEGTKEGRAALLGSLGKDCDWMVKTDKCRQGRVWLRLIIHPRPASLSTDDLVANNPT